MTSRELPHEEWPRLAGTDLEAQMAWLEPSWAKVIVVEDQGEIIGAWAALALIHAEGAWIHPAHRKRSAVARALLRTLYQVLAPWGVSRVISSPSSPEMRALLQRHGQALPAEEYLLCLS